MKVVVSPDRINAGDEIALISKNSAAGAVASFIGLVRDNNDSGKITALELEHYPGMTENSIRAIVAQAEKRWNILDSVVIHRVGKLTVGETIVLVLAVSPHRKDALDACEFIIDFLKTGAPFWKLEHFEDGTSHWVDARKSDEYALEKWTKN